MRAEPVDKARRHQAIRKVLREEEIGSQNALRRALVKRGFPVTQGTLSRDLKELRIPCVPTERGYRYAVEDGDDAPMGPAESAPKQMRSVAAMEVTGIDSNEVGVIVRTLTGRAQGVAVYVDGLGLPDVLATIAGDDTILVMARSIKKTGKVKKELARVLGL